MRNDAGEDRDGVLNLQLSMAPSQTLPYKPSKLDATSKQDEDLLRKRKRPLVIREDDSEEQEEEGSHQPKRLKRTD